MSEAGWSAASVATALWPVLKKHEGLGSLSAYVFSRDAAPFGDLTTRTVQQVLDLQAANNRLLVKKGGKNVVVTLPKPIPRKTSTAAGLIQVVRSTLADLVRKGKVAADALFDENTQRAIATHLVGGRLPAKAPTSDAELRRWIAGPLAAEWEAFKRFPAARDAAFDALASLVGVPRLPPALSSSGAAATRRLASAASSPVKRGPSARPRGGFATPPKPAAPPAPRTAPAAPVAQMARGERLVKSAVAAEMNARTKGIAVADVMPQLVVRLPAPVKELVNDAAGAEVVTLTNGEQYRRLKGETTWTKLGG